MTITAIAARVMGCEESAASIAGTTTMFFGELLGARIMSSRRTYQTIAWRR